MNYLRIGTKLVGLSGNASQRRKMRRKLLRETQR
jgi:hypothetical protein